MKSDITHYVNQSLPYLIWERDEDQRHQQGHSTPPSWRHPPTLRERSSHTPSAAQASKGEEGRGHIVQTTLGRVHMKIDNREVLGPVTHRRKSLQTHKVGYTVTQGLEPWTDVTTSTPRLQQQGEVVGALPGTWWTGQRPDFTLE